MWQGVGDLYYGKGYGLVVRQGIWIYSIARDRGCSVTGDWGLVVWQQGIGACSLTGDMAL